MPWKIWGGSRDCQNIREDIREAGEEAFWRAGEMEQEISAIKLVKIFELEANLKWILFIRNVGGGRDLFGGIVLM